MSTEVEYPEGAVKVLNHGFVKLIDSMGNDGSIVQAARVSYGLGTKTVSEDEGLIRYLLRHKHTTPFEMVEFKFHVRMPIFVARQWIRHRTASVNEVSGRYSEMPELFYVPDVEKITKQSKNNKQGGTDEVIEEANAKRELFQDEQLGAFDLYRQYLDTGMRKELARVNLPLSLYTEFYWKIDLHNLLHFLKLRLDSHAQYEIRVYGEAMAEMVKQIVPMAWEAFEDYSLNSMMLSALDIGALKACINLAPDNSVGRVIDEHFTNKREAEEFHKKLQRILGSEVA